MGNAPSSIVNSIINDIGGKPPSEEAATGKEVMEAKTNSEVQMSDAIEVEDHNRDPQQTSKPVIPEDSHAVSQQPSIIMQKDVNDAMETTGNDVTQTRVPNVLQYNVPKDAPKNDNLVAETLIYSAVEQLKNKIAKSTAARFISKKSEKKHKHTTSSGVRKRYRKESGKSRESRGFLPRKFKYLPLDMKKALRATYKLNNPSTTPTDNPSYPQTSSPKKYAFVIRSTTPNPRKHLPMARRKAQVRFSPDIISTHDTVWTANVALLELLHKDRGRTGFDTFKCRECGSEREKVLFVYWWVEDENGCLHAGFAEGEECAGRDGESDSEGAGEVVVRQDDDCREEQSGNESSDGKEEKADESEEEAESHNDYNDEKENQDENEELQWRGWSVQRQEVQTSKIEA